MKIFVDLNSDQYGESIFEEVNAFYEIYNNAIWLSYIKDGDYGSWTVHERKICDDTIENRIKYGINN